MRGCAIQLLVGVALVALLLLGSWNRRSASAAPSVAPRAGLAQRRLVPLPLQTWSPLQAEPITTTTSSTLVGAAPTTSLRTPAWSKLQVEAPPVQNMSAPLTQVHVITFADKQTVYLHALAASVAHFNNGAPLLVLGLSAQRSPRITNRYNIWNVTRRAISGTDPGKLKKLWFLGALLDDSARTASLGLQSHDLLLFLDAFDCIVQRPLHAFSATWSALVATQPVAVNENEAVVMLAEHSCWPWPLPGMRKVGRPRGVSMNYMANHTFRVHRWPERRGLAPMRLVGNRVGDASGAAVHANGADGDGTTVVVDADQMCAEVARRARRGYWSYANSGVFAGRVGGVHAALGRLNALALSGHFEDQVRRTANRTARPKHSLPLLLTSRARPPPCASCGVSQGMFHVTMLQHERHAVLLDSNASLFASQFAYNSNWWARPACFDDYFDADGAPPTLVATGSAPFALHFNGPAGRHRLGWCIAAALARTARAGQYLVDVDRDGARIPLPLYCDAVGEPRKGATPPPGRRAAVLPACAGGGAGAASSPLACANDHCWVAAK